MSCPGFWVLLVCYSLIKLTSLYYPLPQQKKRRGRVELLYRNYSDTHSSLCVSQLLHSLLGSYELNQASTASPFRGPHAPGPAPVLVEGEMAPPKGL